MKPSPYLKCAHSKDTGQCLVDDFAKALQRHDDLALETELFAANIGLDAGEPVAPHQQAQLDELIDRECEELRVVARYARALWKCGAVLLCDSCPGRVPTPSANGEKPLM